MDIIFDTERLLVKNLTSEEIEKFNDRNIGIYDNNEFTIHLKSNDEKIGAIGFSYVNEKKVELRYEIKKDFQNNGYMTETICYFSKYLFDKNIDKIVIICKTDNISSNKVASKSGFVLLKTFDNGKFGMCNYYELNKGVDPNEQ